MENSTITFPDVEELALFIKAYFAADNTAVFDVLPQMNGTYLLTFTGAY